VATSTSVNITTVGISYDDKSAIVQNTLVGGPAFNSKMVHRGDKIVSIDGVAAKPGDILSMLKVSFACSSTMLSRGIGLG
jgi:C-terminal processing protease CtpA/Prc